MTNKERFHHAHHNEKACNHLDKKGFTDWVITTAFYSAYHYLLHKIFPLKVFQTNNLIPLDSFENYRLFIENGELKQNHQTFKRLVAKEASEVSSVYNQLLDMSQNSRYCDYKSSRKIGLHAKNQLKKIKSFCTK